MKKYALGLVCLCGLLASGCDTDIPTEEIGTSLLNASEYCVLSGGQYFAEENRVTGEVETYCMCGGTRCGKNVNCSIKKDTKDVVCGGTGFVFLTEGLCTMRGVQVCADRIDDNGLEVGYWTECGQDNRWTQEARCEYSNSCKLYLFNGFAMSSQCGDCQNNGSTCISGKEAK